MANFILIPMGFGDTNQGVQRAGKLKEPGNVREFEVGPKKSGNFENIKLQTTCKYLTLQLNSP